MPSDDTIDYADLRVTPEQFAEIHRLSDVIQVLFGAGVLEVELRHSLPPTVLKSIKVIASRLGLAL